MRREIKRRVPESNGRCPKMKSSSMQKYGCDWFAAIYVKKNNARSRKYVADMLLRRKDPIVEISRGKREIDRDTRSGQCRVERSDPRCEDKPR